MRQAEMFDAPPRADNIRIIRAMTSNVSRGGYDEVFSGLSGHLRVATYSAGLLFIKDLIKRFDTIDVILGSEKTLTQEIVMANGLTLVGNKVADAGYQIDNMGGLCCALSKTLRKDEMFMTAVMEARVTFRINRPSLSHDKLFIVSETRGGLPSTVIRGSANLTRAAFNHNQETVIMFDDAAGCVAAAEDWERAMECSVSLPADFFRMAEPDEVVRTEAMRFLFPDAKLIPLEPLRGALAEDVPEITREIFVMPEVSEGNRPPVRYVGPSKASRPVMDLSAISSGVPFKLPVKASPDPEINEMNAFSTDEGRTLNVCSKIVSRAGMIRIGDEQAQAQYSALYEFLSNYMRNPSSTFESQSAVWALTTWFFSTPFLGHARTNARRNDIDVSRYPNHALVTGGAGIGKTTLGDVMIGAVYGRVVRIKQKGLPSISLVKTIRPLLGCYPFIFDDVGARDLGQANRFVSVVKDDDEDLGPTFSSSNEDADQIKDDVRRRCVLVPLGFSQRSQSQITPQDDQIARRARNTGGIPFRHWHERHGEEVAQCLDLLNRSAAAPLFETISETLGYEFRRLVPESRNAAWIKRLTRRDFHRLAHAQTFDSLKRLLTIPTNISRFRFYADAGIRKMDIGFSGPNDQRDYNYFRKNLPGDVRVSDKSSTITLNLDILKDEHGWDVRESRALLGMGRKGIEMIPA